MTMARAHLVDVEVARWYHCITRCVRRAFLLSEGPLDRKQWIENRLKELAEIFGHRPKTAQNRVLKLDSWLAFTRLVLI